MTELNQDVLIVGGGPCGLLLGCELAQAGVDVTIVDKRNGPTLTRAGNLMPRTMEIFDSRGLADQIEARAVELHGYSPRATEGIWAGFRGVRYGALDTHFPYVLYLAQLETENILLQRYSELGGTLLLEHEAVTIEQDAEGVSTSCRTSGGDLLTFRSRYVVGADGWKSFVRDATNIGYREEPEKHVVWGVDARTDLPFEAASTSVTNENGWSLVYPLSKGVTRFGVIDKNVAHLCNRSPTLEQVKTALRNVHGTDFGITEINNLIVFGDGLRVANKMREGRVFLVGDAVRSHYPASGVGMNFGLQDTFNLGWKIAAAIKGWAPDWLLDTFEAERRPLVEAHLNHVRIQTEIQFNYTPGMIALKQFITDRLFPMNDVNLELASHLGGFLAKYSWGENVPDIAGRRLADRPVRTSRGQDLRLFELLRQQKFIYLNVGGGEHPDFAEFEDRIVVATPEKTADDILPFSGILIRPDGHVAACWEAGADKLRAEALLLWCAIPSVATV